MKFQANKEKKIWRRLTLRWVPRFRWRFCFCWSSSRSLACPCWSSSKLSPRKKFHSLSQFPFISRANEEDPIILILTYYKLSFLTGFFFFFVCIWFESLQIGSRSKYIEQKQVLKIFRFYLEQTGVDYWNPRVRLTS